MNLELIADNVLVQDLSLAELEPYSRGDTTVVHPGVSFSSDVTAGKVICNFHLNHRGLWPPIGKPIMLCKSYY